MIKSPDLLTGRLNKTNRWSRRGGLESCFNVPGSSFHRQRVLVRLGDVFVVYCVSTNIILGQFLRRDPNHFPPHPSLFCSNEFSSHPTTILLNKTRIECRKFYGVGTRHFQRSWSFEPPTGVLIKNISYTSNAQPVYCITTCNMLYSFRVWYVIAV